MIKNILLHCRERANFALALALALARHARYADLTVIGQLGRENLATGSHVTLAEVAVMAAEAMQMVAKNIDAGEVLSSAADPGADLLVMGAYGHSRFREIALGGVTRHLLNDMTLPVLISH